MQRTLTTIAVGLVGAVVGAVMGLIVGANVGGNWFTGLTVAGQRGYEATGVIGAMVGAVGVGLVAALFSRRRLRHGWAPSAGVDGLRTDHR